MQESYLTISKTSEGLYKEKGSKFLAFAYPVSSEEEVKACLEGLRKEYYDARHHCYAYVLGAKQDKYRANDDGEPSHSAGDPILGQIKSLNLTDTLVVVVRYFGGTKLGVSGLINAYRTAAEQALKQNDIKEVAITENIKLRFDYEATNEVMRLVKDFDAKITNQLYEADCFLALEVGVGQVERFRDKLQLLQDTGNQLKVE
ncbi:MAG: YigZ family protein [Bacteroidota bacterium]